MFCCENWRNINESLIACPRWGKCLHTSGLSEFVATIIYFHLRSSIWFLPYSMLICFELCQERRANINKKNSSSNFWRLVNKIRKFPLVPSGVLAPGSAHARPSAQPPSTIAEIFRRTCLQSNLQNFQGQGAGSKFVLPEFLFLLVRSPCKISEPYDNPFCGFE